jgi:hypothetical protein
MARRRRLTKLSPQELRLPLLYRGHDSGPDGCIDHAELGPRSGKRKLPLPAEEVMTHKRDQFVFSSLNQIPKESHDADFSRIKPWYLDGQ